MSHHCAADGATSLLLFGYDVTDWVESERQLTERAFLDPLTGVGNRAYIRKRIKEFTSGPKQAQRLAVALMDLDGFKAINKLSLDIAAGELRCIIGPNGAGKTTMMDIITGKTRPDEGQVFFGSTIDLLRHNEPQIAQMGIGRKFQKPTVFEQLTVFENLELALKTAKGVAASLRFSLKGEQKDRLVEVCTRSSLLRFC